MKVMIVAAACGLLALSSAAAAQEAGARYNIRVPTIDMTARIGGSAEDRYLRDDRLADSFLAIDQGTQARSSLTERITPMVAQGRCNDARRAARAAGDRPVSRHISQICVEGRPTRM